MRNRKMQIWESVPLYEPDPRHVELLARALNLEGANSKATPGEKPHAEAHEEPNDDLADLVSFIAEIKAQRVANSKVTFGDSPSVLPP